MPGEDARRMAIAPEGNRMTNARAARIPWAMSILVMFEGAEPPKGVKFAFDVPSVPSSQ